MFKLIERILSPEALSELREIAAAGTFVDGRLTNPHNRTKQNVQLSGQDVLQRSSRLMAQALYASEEFRNFAFPRAVAPPLITAYRENMRYGLHADAAFMPISDPPMRSDLSCTIFLSDLSSYDGGALRIVLGSAEINLRGPAGSAIVYPSNTLHEVTAVTRGERLVGLTFIESQVPNSERREWLYELNEVAALEGGNMSHANFTRLQRVQANLLRHLSTTG